MTGDVAPGADLPAYIESLYNAAEEKRGEADRRLEELQDYIDAEEHEINEIYRQADELSGMAYELEYPGEYKDE